MFVLSKFAQGLVPVPVPGIFPQPVPFPFPGKCCFI